MNTWPNTDCKHLLNQLVITKVSWECECARQKRMPHNEYHVAISYCYYYIEQSTRIMALSVCLCFGFFSRFGKHFEFDSREIIYEDAIVKISDE